MAQNGIYYSSGNSLNFTTNDTTWATLTSGGTFVIDTISGGTYDNLPYSGTVDGSGNVNYISKFTAVSTIGDSQIFDGGSIIGIGGPVAPTYGEFVNIDTSNKGIVIDDLYIIQTGYGSIGFGTSSDYSAWSGSGEIAIGTRGVLINSTGSGNIGIGDKALSKNTIGNENIAIGGTGTLLNNAIGSQNISIGYESMNTNDSGGQNIAIGKESLFSNIVGNRTVAIGTGAGFNNDAGYNIFIGHSAGYTYLGSNGIIIGYGASFPDDSQNHALSIGDLIYGSLSAKTVGINVTAQTNTFHVSASTDPVRFEGLQSSVSTRYLVSDNNGVVTYRDLPVSSVTNGTGISASTSSGTVTITNTDLGSSQNIFKNIKINGTTQFSAGSNNADLNFSGINMTITSAATNTLVFSAGTGSGGVSGSGTSNYIPKWTGTTALGNSLIQDNGTNIGVNTTPSSSYKMSIYSITNTPLYVQNQTSNGTSISVYSNGSGSQTGISSIGYGGASSNNTGVIGQAYDGLLAIGIKGNVGITEFGSITTGIGGYFDGIGDGGYGVPTNSYSVQLIDGTEGTNKVLVSVTSDGKANWSNTLTGLTSVSATTYYNLPVSGLTQGSNITITNNGSGNYTIASTGGGGVSLGTVYTTGNNLNFI